MKLKLNHNGFSLIELVIYISIFVLILSIVISFTVVFLRSYGNVEISNTINNSAIVSLERMVREIRFAENINTTLSILNSPQGRLVLNTNDDIGQPLVLDFYLNNGVLELRKDGVYFGALTNKDVFVERLLFRLSNNGVSDIVKIEMDIKSTLGSLSKIETFLASALVR